MPPGRLLLAFSLALAALACSDRGRAPTTPEASAVARVGSSTELLVDRAREAGLDFVHDNGMTGKRYMAEVMGAGAALFDYDGDGDLDAYLVQGGPLGPEMRAQAPAGPSDRLFRNDLEVRPDGSRSLRFTDISEASGIADATRGYGMGVAVGDYDGDGDPDLYVTRLGPNQLLRNEAGGTFRDVTREASAEEERWSVPAVFSDLDGDGDLDLFVGNYVEFPFDPEPDCRNAAGSPDYCGPGRFAPLPDRLLKNRGDGTFEDWTAATGLGGARGRALGVVAEDFDGDGRGELYVANDGMPNHLWRPRPDVGFRDEALVAGAAVNGLGQAEGSMGVDAADLDDDGDLDLFLTHLITETNTLYLNDGRGLFTDATDLAGLGAPSRLHTAFGTGFFDLENDGHLDLLVVNGAVQNLEALVAAGDPFPLHEPDQLFRGRAPRQAGGPARFEEASHLAGETFRRSEVSRGAAFGDVDNDGDTDVLVTHNHGRARLLINQAADGSSWLGVHLLEGEPPREVPGARAALLLDGRPKRWRRVRAGGSYASAHDPRILFGLAAPGSPVPVVEGVRVIWPDGTVEDFFGLAEGNYNTLRKGGGRRPPVMGEEGGR